MAEIKPARQLPKGISDALYLRTEQRFTAFIPGHPGDLHIGLVRDDTQICHMKIQGTSVLIREATDYKYKDLLPPLLFAESFITKLVTLDKVRINTIDVANLNGGNPETLDKIKHLYNSLSPILQSAIYCFDLGPTPKTASGHAVSKIGLIRFNAPYCGSTPYHEAAHLRTHQYMKDHKIYHPKEIFDWIEIQQGLDESINWKRWHTIVPYPEKKLHSKFDYTIAHKYGFVSHYATTNPDEDISETTACIYTRPKLYRKLMSKNDIFKKKLEFLNKNGYIRKDQYDYLTGKTNRPPATLTEECQ